MSRLIDANELRRRMYEEAFEKDSKDQRWDSGCWIRYRLFEKILKEQPTIEPDREVGKWIKVMEGNAYRDKCSRCSETYPNACGYNFCPNCGRKMEVVG